MKAQWFIPILLLLAACKSQKAGSQNTIEEKEAVSMTSVCPDDGKCTLEIFRNKRLNVVADQYGSIYYQMLDDANTTVVQYLYDRNVPKGLQDANYREEIVFEIKNSDRILSLKDSELKKTQMLFGRFCFCRGETGYYKVEKGALELSQKGNTIMFSLDFAINKVPQIIKTIQARSK